MPKTISDTELFNNYEVVSEYCHTSSEPVFVTRDGIVDLVIMSYESYEQILSIIEHYESLLKSVEEITGSKE